MCSSFFMLTFLNPYLFNYTKKVIPSHCKVTYLAYKSRIGRSREVLGEDLLLEFVHGVYHEIMTSSFGPVDYVLKFLLLNCTVQIGDEGGDFTLPLDTLCL